MFLVFSDNETPAKRKSCLYGIAVIVITLYQRVNMKLTYHLEMHGLPTNAKRLSFKIVQR